MAYTDSAPSDWVRFSIDPEVIEWADSDPSGWVRFSIAGLAEPEYTDSAPSDWVRFSIDPEVIEWGDSAPSDWVRFSIDPTPGESVTEWMILTDDGWKPAVLAAV